MTMAIFGALTMLAVAARWQSGTVEALSVLGVGATAAAIVVVVRSLVLPRLEIRPAEGVLRNRRRTTPFSALSAVAFIDHGRAGTWADFVGAEGKRAARMSLSGSLFANPDSLQWAALRDAIHRAVVSGGVRPETPAVTADGWMPAGTALEILDAQIAWCQAGNNSASRHAPAAALIGRRISLLDRVTR